MSDPYVGSEQSRTHPRVLYICSARCSARASGSFMRYLRPSSGCQECLATRNISPVCPACAWGQHPGQGRPALVTPTPDLVIAMRHEASPSPKGLGSLALKGCWQTSPKEAEKGSDGPTFFSITLAGAGRQALQFELRTHEPRSLPPGYFGSCPPRINVFISMVRSRARLCNVPRLALL